MHSGRRHPVAWISDKIPAQGGMSLIFLSSACIRDELFDSTQIGFLIHSTIRRMPSRHAFASASPDKLQHFRVLQAVNNTFRPSSRAIIPALVVLAFEQKYAPLVEHLPSIFHYTGSTLHLIFRYCPPSLALIAL
jgi:hypothetical protein